MLRRPFSQPQTLAGLTYEEFCAVTDDAEIDRIKEGVYNRNKGKWRRLFKSSVCWKDDTRPI